MPRLGALVRWAMEVGSRSSMDNLWLIMVYMVDISGLYIWKIDNLWKIYGESMENLWRIYGYPDCPLKYPISTYTYEVASCYWVCGLSRPVW